MAYDPESLKKALDEVERRVAAAAARASRSSDDVTIVGVTKRHPAALIEAAHRAGITDVGENYAQELAGKFDEVSVASQLCWHFVGHLQRNKVKDVVGRATLIHAVDSERLAQEVNKQAAKCAQDGRLADGVQRVLVAVNIGGEEQKSGVSEDEVGSLLDVISRLPHVTCTGLMTMPPFANAPEDNRTYFRKLAALRDNLIADHGSLSQLSMGTTGDFEVAVEEGATLVRIGTALFGERPAGAVSAT